MQKSYTGRSTAWPAFREFRHSRMPCMSNASAHQPTSPHNRTSEANPALPARYRVCWDLE